MADRWGRRPGEKRRYEDSHGEGPPVRQLEADVAKEQHQKPRRWERRSKEDNESNY